ncbi:pyridoxamine 5'-phosphate oxidase [Streptomyces sp. Amel2xB2]|uniref:Pyridoxamine 5'-phosphate oxidase n=1 Tax=Streptomyces nanshensis TaxID=518642 RepID=A0A1E7L7J8_9ACTN|nr:MULTISPECIES: pyridoxamine 5'-phosphate oxidase family protein [Streptomyces]OEV12140.1 pyridoxamine 5'-phosphate oxidase [Streptomyces nanshensis]RAJ69208.1 pyridoxamine 5'-phosphate oxidase [Streptomyces sp. Amel2xB2]
MTVSWAAFRAAEPEFADVVRARFAAFQHHVLATLRPDGSPRLSGLEGDFRGDELWLGMMIGSRKALDLRRDPRFSMHANPGTGTGMHGGDVRVSGRAVEVSDPEEFARYAAGAEQGEAPERFHLFRAELSEVVRVTIEDPHIVFQVWHPGHALRTIRRADQDSTVLEDV